MGDRNDSSARSINTTTKDTTSAFDHPQMISQRATVQIYPELLRPKGEQAMETIGGLAGKTIVPAIDQSNNLRTPCPVPPRAHRCVHSGLHGVEIAHFLDEGSIVNAADMRVIRPDDDGDFRTHRAHCLLAQVIELRENSRRNS